MKITLKGFMTALAVIVSIAFYVLLVKVCGGFVGTIGFVLVALVVIDGIVKSL